MKNFAKWVGAGMLLVAGIANAQGVLTLTPGTAAATIAGNGTLGSSGDNGPAAAATLATPAAVAYDAGGNLYIADATNHTVREVLRSSGTIILVAGTGIAGFSGDGGTATAAQLDTPTGIAIDTAGALYIADSHNNRIRRVTGGTITTIAGTGTAGFGGDGTAATAAQLASPQGIAVNAAGTLFIADTGNHRVRRIVGSTITTVAGTGDQGYSGDGGIATTATLDSPTGVAIDTAGTLYIADSHNQRVRSVSAAGVISTAAGSGASTFPGAFSGDGGSAAAAALNRPTGVNIDAAGNLYIADTNNQRIRTVTAGSITTAAGTGQQGFAGDGGPPAATALDTPKTAAVDAFGDFAVADTGNRRVRGAADASLTFATSAVGTASVPQIITLTNTGNASLTVAAIAFTGPYTSTSASSCTATPVTLAASASCTEVLSFTPGVTGPSTGSVSFSGPGVAPQTLLLSGVGTAGTSTVALSSSAAAPFVNQSVTLTATVSPANGPTGTVAFYSGSSLLGSVQLVNGAASFTTQFATPGTYSVTAIYSGDANYQGSTSAVLAQAVTDFGIAAVPSSSAAPDGSASVIPGQAAVFNVTISPLNGLFPYPVTLSATGLPAGATATFSPQTMTPGGSAASVRMTVQVPPTHARGLPAAATGIAAALLVLPFGRRLRHGGRRLRSIWLVTMAVLGLGGAASLSGCGTGSGYFGQPEQVYSITVTGTAQGTNGASLQHSTTVRLRVQ